MAEFDDGDPIIVTCRGNNCEKWENVKSWDEVRYHPWMRQDAYGMTTGHYCDECYANNYPYRKDRYYDPSYAGERMEE